MEDNLSIRRDRMRFTKNTASSRLALLAIILNVLFFISIYRVNQTAYYTWWMGISIIYNLVFMLAAFLASEGAKNYNRNYSVLMVLLGIGQVARIFILPPMMHEIKVDEKAGEFITKVITPAGGSAAAVTQEIENRVMTTAQFNRTIIYLALSAACLIAAALINWFKSRQLAAHMAEISADQA